MAVGLRDGNWHSLFHPLNESVNVLMAVLSFYKSITMFCFICL